MNKSTYNSLKRNLEKVANEAWEKYYEMVCEKRPTEVAKYYEIYEKTNYLVVRLRTLLEE